MWEFIGVSVILTSNEVFMKLIRVRDDRSDLSRFSVAVLCCLSIFNSSESVSAKPQAPKNVIMFIGDGMGLASITSARVWSKGSTGRLAMETFPITGVAKTHSSSNFVTDSAASATALASGIKTYNGAIGMTDPKLDPKRSSRPVETIFDIVGSMGKVTGVVTTTRITHATPASYYAHVEARSMEEEIASWLAKSSLTLALGGGRQFFYPASWHDVGGSKQKGLRRDNVNLIQKMKQSGWEYASSPQELNRKDFGLKKKVLGLFNYDHLSYERSRSRSQKVEPSLAEMVRFSINRLSSHDEGYMLLVEGGRIDHAAHANNVPDALGEVVAFDNAIAVALKETSADDTLIVVTADHETGGMALSGYLPLSQAKGDKIFRVQRNFLEEPTEDKRSLFTWATGPGPNRSNFKDEHTSGTAFYSEMAAHTAVDVLVLARGPGAHKFSGFMNNIDIPFRIASALNKPFTASANLVNHRQW